MFDGQPHTIDYYTKLDGSCPFQAWFDELKNKQAAMSIDVRITRLQAGNAGNAKSVGGGVYELKVDLGKGYRVYFALSGERVVLLLWAVISQHRQVTSKLPKNIGRIIKRGSNNENLGRILA